MRRRVRAFLRGLAGLAALYYLPGTARLLAWRLAYTAGIIALAVMLVRAS